MNSFINIETGLNTIIKFAFCICFVSSFTRCLNAQKPDPIPAIEELIAAEYRIDSSLTPGFILGIVFPDTSIIYSYGNHGKDDTSYLKANEVFEIGGLTKVFTAEMLVHLANKEEINLVKQVGALVSTNMFNPNYPTLNLIQLMEHRSGFPRVPFGIGKFEVEQHQPYAQYSKDTLFQVLRTIKSNKIGKEKNAFSYSHLNYACIEVLMESSYEKPFSELMDHNIFLPFGMQQSSLYSSLKHESELTTGYTKTGDSGSAMEFKSFEGALGMRSSMQDLMRFCQYKLSKLEKEGSWEKEDEFAGGGLRRHLDNELGWYVLWKRNKPLIYSHSGHTNMHSAYVHLVPESGIGVIILANSATGTGDLSLKILNLLHYYKL